MALRKKTLVFDSAVIEAIPDGDLDAAEAVVGPGVRLATADAAETLVFARMLETVKNRVYEKKFPPLKCRMFVPESNEGGPVSETLVYRVWESFVLAKVCGPYATDIPMVSSVSKEMMVRYFSVKDGYKYSIDDLRKAAAAGIELTTKYAETARRGIELARDGITAFGVPEIGTYGLANHPNATLFTLATGDWATASGVAILADLNAMITSMLVNTLEIFEPDTVLLSTQLYRVIATKFISADANNASNKTVLEAFKDQNPGIQVMSWTKLRGTSADGLRDRVIVYKRDPEVLEFEVGVEFEILPVEYGQGHFTHVCQARYAGVQVHYPLAVMYADNA